MGLNNAQNWCKLCQQRLAYVRGELGFHTSGQHPDGKISGRENECIMVAQRCHAGVDDLCLELHNQVARDLVPKATERAIAVLRWARDEWALGNAACTPPAIAQDYYRLAEYLADFLACFHDCDRVRAVDTALRSDRSGKRRRLE